MHNDEPKAQTGPTQGYTFQNDFLALSKAFSLPEIDYADISQREQLAAAIRRWPLLAELSRQQ
ncbi:Cellulose biosynthesis protein BcsR [Kosakonia arachidis]|uniref:Cellulose biosynthesis protein BcsR n=1 Tax=Kosakonia arachidis TaxID=551989 RepID=A0A1I7DKD5_9ENTR|nr:cellulose biosynthesis protein BcsR [Kosakonia arachidis]SFU12094.1 Cellulose biosynthesis protein BcsR [Kosakonia arachidis]